MKRLFIILLFATFFVSSTQADNLGRLFFTPEQRAQLDYNHARNGTGDDASTSELMVNGIVQQHAGTRTIWLNGTSQKSLSQGDPAAEAVLLPGKSQTIKIKVGQKLLLDIPQSSAASTE